jgi:hypothetical protein
MIYGNLSLIVVGYLELWSTKWGARDVPCVILFLLIYVCMIKKVETSESTDVNIWNNCL